jgi:hypothetical protein
MRSPLTMVLSLAHHDFRCLSDLRRTVSHGSESLSFTASMPHRWPSPARSRRAPHPASWIIPGLCSRAFENTFTTSCFISR